MKRVLITLAASLTVLLQSCSSLGPHWKEVVNEIGVTKTLIDIDETHNSGPAGINGALTIFELDQATSEQITQAGVSYFEQLKAVTEFSESRSKILSEMYLWYRETKPHDNWQQTPIQNSDLSTKSVTELLGGTRTYTERILARLPQAYFQQLETAISDSGSFYSYGGFRNSDLLIVCPALNRIFRIHNG